MAENQPLPDQLTRPQQMLLDPNHWDGYSIGVGDTTLAPVWQKAGILWGAAGYNAMRPVMQLDLSGLDVEERYADGIVVPVTPHPYQSVFRIDEERLVTTGPTQPVDPERFAGVTQPEIPPLNDHEHTYAIDGGVFQYVRGYTFATPILRDGKHRFVVSRYEFIPGKRGEATTIRRRANMLPPNYPLVVGRAQHHVHKDGSETLIRYRSVERINKPKRGR